MKLTGKTIVITGAGAGIGRELTLLALSRGARVAAVDMSDEGLAETERLAAAGDRLSRHIANITDREGLAGLPAAVEAALGPVDGLINNAGIVQSFADVAEIGFDAIDRLTAINFMGPINVTKAFLPGLLTRPEGHIVNVASLAGIVAFPGQTIYSATKGGVRLFSEGLYAELLNTPVRVSVAMPGQVATEIAAHSGVGYGGHNPSASDWAKGLAPAEAAREILDGMEADRLHIIVGKDARSLWPLSRIAPRKTIGMVWKAMQKMRE